MELKPGYKQTEVGIIPNEWDVVPIGGLVFDFRGGASFKPSDFTGTGVKVLPKGGVGRTGWLNIAEGEQKYCSPEYAAANYRNQVDKSYTIVVLRDLVPSGPSIGLIVRIRDRETYVLAQGVYGFKINEKAVPGFLVHLSNTSWYRKLANSIMVGSTQVHITNTAYKKALIPLPPLPEQEAIAEALSDVDAFIETLEQLIAKKRQVKQGAMQELLTGKRRLLGFSGEWKLKKIGDITQSTAGGTPSTAVASYWGGNIRWMSSGELHLKRVYDVDGRITEEGLRNSSTKIIPPRCVLVGLAGQGKTRGTVAMNMVELCTNQSIAAIFPSSSFVPDYLFFNLDNRYEELREVSSGDGGRGGLNLTLINKLELPLPSIPEQTAIAEILSDMDAEITALEGKLSKAREVKLGMMQELLTGKVRLV